MSGLPVYSLNPPSFVFRLRLESIHATTTSSTPKMIGTPPARSPSPKLKQVTNQPSPIPGSGMSSPPPTHPRQQPPAPNAIPTTTRTTPKTRRVKVSRRRDGSDMRFFVTRKVRPSSSFFSFRQATSSRTTCDAGHRNQIRRYVAWFPSSSRWRWVEVEVHRPHLTRVSLPFVPQQNYAPTGPSSSKAIETPVPTRPPCAHEPCVRRFGDDASGSPEELQRSPSPRCRQRPAGSPQQHRRGEIEGPRLTQSGRVSWNLSALRTN
jgi:hypothetical protein